MPSVYDVAQEHRESLLRQDRKTTRDLIAAYGDAWRAIRAEVSRLTDQIAFARQQGQDVPVSWLYEQDRLGALERQVATTVGQLAGVLGSRLVQEQGAAVALAAEHTAAEVAAAGTALTFAALPTEAITSLVGFTANGSPLRSLLDTLGPDAGKRVRDALITGVAAGQGVREIARASRQALGGNMARALLVSRTEVLRAYREAAHQTRLQNRDVLRGWTRVAALQGRTCAACLALHGRTYRLETRLAEHPGGRCVAVPLVRGDTLSVPSGVDWFARQDTRTQEAVLGKAGAAAYADGAVSLEDFVGTRRSRAWGDSHYARSLRQVVGGQEARAWARAA